MGYRANLKPGDFLVSEDPEKSTTWHLPITKTSGGEPDRGLASAAWAALFAPGGHRGNKYEGPKKNEAQRKLVAIYKRMGWAPSSPYGPRIKEFGVKAIEHGDDRYVVLWTSNAFQDREKEIFATQSWKDYVARREASGLQDRVWFWHVKGTDFATVVWQDVVGRILVEVAKVDNTPYANKMFHALQHPEEFGDLLPYGWGTSHGYLYRHDDKESGVYKFVEKFESTVLPYHKASNLYSKVREVLDMSVRQDKKDGLVALVGEDLAAQMLADATKATAELEQLGVSFAEHEEETETGDKAGAVPTAKKKPPVPPTPPAEEDEDEEDMEEGGEKVFEMELDDALLKQIAEHVEVKGVSAKQFEEVLTAFRAKLLADVKELISGVGTKEEIVQDAMAGRLILKPYVASKSNGNVTPEDELSQSAKTREEEGDKARRQKDPVKALVANVFGMQE